MQTACFSIQAFGFGKSQGHNYELLSGLTRFSALGAPLLVGISRKSMIGAATGRSVDQRLAGSVAAATLALQGGASIIRSPRCCCHGRCD